MASEDASLILLAGVTTAPIRVQHISLADRIFSVSCKLACNHLSDLVDVGSAVGFNTYACQIRRIT
jgi:hypothetical protein